MKLEVLLALFYAPFKISYRKSAVHEANHRLIAHKAQFSKHINPIKNTSCTFLYFLNIINPILLSYRILHAFNTLYITSQHIILFLQAVPATTTFEITNNHLHDETNQISNPLFCFVISLN